MDGLRILLGPIISTPLLFSILTGLSTVILLCIFTRVNTTLRFNQRALHGEPTTIGVIPYWIPWLGHTLSSSMGGQAFLNRCGRYYKRAAFAIVLRGKNHIVVTAPSLVKQLEDSHAMEPNTDAARYKLRHFFGDRSNKSRSIDTLACHNKDKVMLMGSDGVSWTDKHIARIARALERTAYNLISFNESWIDQSSWERTSKAIIQPDYNTGAEVSFFPLIETFVGELASTVLMGRNFMENNPDFLEDFQTWNSRATSFMNRMPFFMPQMSAASAARERVLLSLATFRRTLAAHIAGDDTGSSWGDLDDVSPFLVDRTKSWKSQSASAPGQPDVSVDAALLWAFNKPNTLIAWLLYRVYSDTALLEAVRKDVEPFVRVKQVQSGLPISEPPRVNLDTEGLMKESSLLRGAMDETLRLHANTITYGVMTKDLIITKSQTDAADLGKSKPDTYILRKGETVCVPHRATQMHISIADGPGIFNPAGFSSLANVKIPSAHPVDAVKSNMFGVGDVRCPGERIAEHEIMIVAAGMLTMWDVEPASGEWTWPGQKPGLCSMLPIKDVRVKISRRTVAKSTEWGKS